MRQWSIPETNQVWIQPDKCQILRTSNWRRKNLYGPRKAKGIRDWPTPTTVKQTQGFLGFWNFYRQFIWHFSELAKLLNDLLKKDQTFEWTDNCQKAFEELKKQFTEEPVLMMPDQSRPFQIKTDASKYATGAVLTQLDSNGDRHPVSIISKTFSLAERNDEIYDWELLRSLEHWKNGDTTSKDLHIQQ